MSCMQLASREAGALTRVLQRCLALLVARELERDPVFTRFSEHRLGLFVKAVAFDAAVLGRKIVGFHAVGRGEGGEERYRGGPSRLSKRACA